MDLMVKRFSLRTFDTANHRRTLDFGYDLWITMYLYMGLNFLDTMSILAFAKPTTEKPALYYCFVLLHSKGKQCVALARRKR
jgi:hypothetical protein